MRQEGFVQLMMRFQDESSIDLLSLYDTYLTTLNLEGEVDMVQVAASGTFNFFIDALISTVVFGLRMLTKMQRDLALNGCDFTFLSQVMGKSEF